MRKACIVFLFSNVTRAKRKILTYLKIFFLKLYAYIQRKCWKQLYSEIIRLWMLWLFFLLSFNTPITFRYISPSKSSLMIEVSVFTYFRSESKILSLIFFCVLSVLKCWYIYVFPFIFISALFSVQKTKRCKGCLKEIEKWYLHKKEI